MTNGCTILASAGDNEKVEDERDALQSFLPAPLTLPVEPERDDSVDEKESAERFTRFHALTCVLGFLVLQCCMMITISGMFLNIRPYNCTAEEANSTEDVADDAILPELPWSEHQGFRSSLSQQYKLCSKATGDLTNVVYFFGTIAGCLMAGPTSDRVGRKPCILAGQVLTALASLASNYAPSLWLHLAFRVLAGCFMMFSLSAVLVYGSEVHSPRHRGRYVAAWSAGVSVGTLASGMLAHLTRDHQLHVLISCCVTVVPLLLALCLPESPVWLAARGRLDDSEAAFRRIDAINGRQMNRLPPPPCDISIPHAESQNSGCGSGWNCHLVRLACLLGFHGVFVGLNCYGFYFVMSSVIPDVCLYAMLLGTSQLPYLFLFNLVPRRPGVLAFSLLSGLLSLGFGAATHFLTMNSTVAGVGGVGGALLAGLGVAGSFCSTAAFNLLVAVSAESFPTGIRNTGLGLCTFCLRCGATLAPLVNFLPGATLRSLALGCPLLLTCLPLGLALGGCGRSCGCQFLSDDEEAAGDARTAASEKIVIPIENSQLEFDTKA